MWQARVRLMVIVVSFFLAACANTARPGRQVPPEADWHEYVVYRIDDNRYISILSPQTCDGYLDGNIYYNDTHTGIRTFVSFAGWTANGLYQGYYAVQSDPNYIAIPIRRFSQTIGMLIRIYYSYDGGRTFHWFATGGNDKHSAIILDGKLLYRTRIDPSYPNDYANYGASVYDISQDMGDSFAHYDPATTFETYGRSVPRHQVPFDLKSPSGATRWSCPGASGQ